MKVFCDYLGPRLDVVAFFGFTHECMIKIFTNDYVRCFDSVLKSANETEINLAWRHVIFYRRDYQIQKYYGLTPNWLHKLLLDLH